MIMMFSVSFNSFFG
nr:unnamed protein product [Callosobruchus analis]